MASTDISSPAGLKGVRSRLPAPDAWSLTARICRRGLLEGLPWAGEFGAVGLRDESGRLSLL